MQSVYEAAGGRQGLLRLAGAWHSRVMADEIVSHAFSHGFHPQHTERLAAYWAEALGGPAVYSGTYGDETSVVRIHSGNGPHQEMDRRAIACFDQAMQDAGLDEAGPLRQVLHDYFAWATTTTMARYHESADQVPEGMSIPRWSWDGLQISRTISGYERMFGGKGTKLPERSGTLADDPFSGRHPTSHERLTGLPWEASYHDGPAPWDTGQPQPAIVRLASEGGFAGAVLDAGCGTGENALHVAALGLPVLGADVAETALAIARAKAADRGIEVEFAAADAFQLERLGRRFDTVLDCGLFHTFDGDERPGYVTSLASVTEHDGTLYVLCFSDDGPDTGPHPISQEELRAAFSPGNGWNVAAIEPDRVQTRYHDDGAPAWFATIKRI